MRNQKALFRLLILILASLVILTSLVLINSWLVRQDNGPNDFLTSWASIRWYMTRGWEPYGEQTAKEIQNMAYGREAKPGEDQGFFLYPLYSILIYGPFGLIGDYPTARILWMVAMELCLMASLGFGIALSRWSIPAWKIAVLAFFLLIWHNDIRGIVTGSITPLILLLVSLAMILIRSDQDQIAGFFLALATIRLDLVGLLICFVMIWALSIRRTGLVWGFLWSLALLIIASSLLKPDWFAQFIRRIFQYSQETFLLTPRNILAYWLPGVGNQFGKGLTFLAFGVMILEWWFSLGQDFRWFYWTACVTLSLTNFIGIPLSVENYILLIPALMLFLCGWDQRWGMLGQGLSFAFLIILLGAPWILALRDARSGINPGLDVWLLFMTPFLVILGLYWVRWWATHPPHLMVEISRILGSQE